MENITLKSIAKSVTKHFEKSDFLEDLTRTPDEATTVFLDER